MTSRVQAGSLIMVAMLAIVASQPAARAETIDTIVSRIAIRDGVPLSPVVDDDLFLRRVSLDLIGRIPTQQELLQFREAPDRGRVVDRLLESSQHSEFWSRLWTATLIGYGQAQQFDRESLRTWLEEQFSKEAAFDQVAYQLIAAEGRSAFMGPANFVLRHAQDPVVPIGRIFLGVQLDCARCHDHPSDRWTQQDFQGMERFFADLQVRRLTPGNYELVDRRGNQGAKPRFLTGAEPKTGSWRQELALLVTTSKPFARATANRLWYHFFGHGMSESPDNINSSSDSDFTEVVHYLANRLHEDDFHWKDLIREICCSQAYQRGLSSSHPEWPLMPTAKPMTADQLFASLNVALGSSFDEARRTEFTREASSVSLDIPFSNAWDSEERVQALMTRMSLGLGNQRTNVTELFERVLSHKPSPEQLELCRDQASADILFALINSNEFYFWH